MSKKWTTDRIEETLAILTRSHDYSQALEEIEETSNSLASAFSRHGLEAPTTYLAESESEALFRRTRTLPEGMESIVVFNDVHVPFHNKNAVAAVMEFCRDIQPDAIVINGDFLDCYSISSFHKAPGAPTLQRELDEGLEILDQLRRFCPLSKIWYTEGNHEERLRRLIKQQHGLYGLRAFELESLLEFDRLGIEYHQYGDIVWFGDLAIYHGTHVSGHAGYSAKRELERGGFRYCITGHVHRLAFHHRKGYTGNRWAIENGGLFDIEQCDYMLNPNWMNGFCIIHRDDANDVMQPNLIAVEYDGSFLWNNKYYGK